MLGHLKPTEEERRGCDIETEMTLLWKEEETNREGRMVSGNACIHSAPIKVMQNGGEVRLCVCLWEIRWKRGHNLPL